MAFRSSRLRDILQAKGLVQPADVHHRTGIPYPQLGRYSKSKGRPDVDTLAKLVMRLELDANYLLDTDPRYQNMEPIRAAANMSLERYLVERNLEGQPVKTSDLEMLRRVADRHSAPPVWVADWKKEHESISLRSPANREPTPMRGRPHRVRRGSLRS